jgi:hypothetical protein
MSDYQNSDDPFYHYYFDDPLRRDHPDARAPNAAWLWIGAAVFLVVVLAVASGIGCVQ